MLAYTEQDFSRKIELAQQAVKKVLANNRNPQLPSNVSHQYVDKFDLANFLTNAALASQLNSLAKLGLTTELLTQLKTWQSENRSVTFAFSAQEECAFDKKKKRTIEPDVTHKSTTDSSFFGKTTYSSKTVTTVTDYFWTHIGTWQLYAYQGNNDKDRVVLQVQKFEHKITTNSDSPPLPKAHVTAPIELNITWLLQQLNSEGVLAFQIDRTAKDCHTPRRNGDVKKAWEHCLEFYALSERVNQRMRQLFSRQTSDKLDMSAISCQGIFVPILPLFETRVEHKDEIEEKEEEKNTCLVAVGPAMEGGPTSPLLPLGDVHKFLGEQQRSMSEKLAALAKVFPTNSTPISVAATTVVVVLSHVQQCCESYNHAVQYIEHLLKQQLLAAIGKEVTPQDFQECMEFHNRKMFKDEYAPQNFCYAIRRPDHYPEGTLSIVNSENKDNPIYTSVRQSNSDFGMKFKINAATECTFFGKRYLHASIMHKFSGQTAPQISLSARARQFSSFILMVGTVSSADTFEAKHAIIIQNKDDLKIPLLLETIPTPKEFKDAIESLSPEQQRFCKAFRAMQLASTLFAVCVIQIKPQLEKLLNLPEDSLTKEIRLNQDLMELFIKYQIPSDLISYAGDASADRDTKLSVVKTHVQNMNEMIQSSKDVELKEQVQHSVYDALPNSSVHLQLNDCFDSFNERARSPPPAAPMAMNMSMMQPMACLSSPASSSSAMNRRMMMRKSASRPAPQMPQMMQQQQQQSMQQQQSQTGVCPTSKRPQNGQQQQQPQDKDNDKSVKRARTDGPKEDYTLLPGQLDSKFEALDEDNCLRPTTIKLGDEWACTRQKGLLAKASCSIMYESEQTEEKNRAFDLLDALTRSGVLSLDHAELHVIVIATHCFDKTIVDTVIQDNINPVEKLERSNLIVASTVHNAAAAVVVNTDSLQRLTQISPLLFAA